MKKIFITTLLTVSTVAFAKTEEPKTKTDLPKKEEKVLVAKKTIKGNEVPNNNWTLQDLFKHPCETFGWVKNPEISVSLLAACVDLLTPKK
ncbi:hypothetical protein [Chryseobacterium hispalense]|uniref:hypothetical protein n=1 Tax=Chryseobacterium hispalense TaxID=1453492 RepID=UPI00391D1246